MINGCTDAVAPRAFVECASKSDTIFAVVSKQQSGTWMSAWRLRQSTRPRINLAEGEPHDPICDDGKHGVIWLMGRNQIRLSTGIPVRSANSGGFGVTLEERCSEQSLGSERKETAARRSDSRRSGEGCKPDVCQGRYLSDAEDWAERESTVKVVCSRDTIRQVGCILQYRKVYVTGITDIAEDH